MGAVSKVSSLGNAAAQASGSALRWRSVFDGDGAQVREVRRWLTSLLPDCPARDAQRAPGPRGARHHHRLTRAHNSLAGAPALALSADMRSPALAGPEHLGLSACSTRSRRPGRVDTNGTS
jgi:hypothetical protein